MRAGKGFETVECYTGLKNVKLPAGCVVLLECMSNLVANEMFEEQGAHDRTVSEVTKGIENLLEQAAHVVIVTNEIFSDAVVFDGDMDSYLEYLGKINQEIAKKAEEMAKTVKQAIETYGTTHIWGLGDVYAYEVDGFGQYNLMDDANVPSLLAMSYLGYEPESQEVADNTRKLILSEANPFYYAGTKLSGIGSPHTPVRYVWHISKAIEGLTAPTKEEKHQMIHELMATDGGTGLMHEGVFVDDPTVYTREWFSWANAMFCELVMQYCGYEIKK